MKEIKRKRRDNGYKFSYSPMTQTVNNNTIP